MIALHGTDLGSENFTLYGPAPGREPLEHRERPMQVALLFSISLYPL
jgi:hypothetical protein